MMCDGEGGDRGREKERGREGEKRREGEREGKEEREEEKGKNAKGPGLGKGEDGGFLRGGEGGMAKETYYIAKETYHIASATYYIAKETYYIAKKTYHIAKETYYIAKETYHIAKETYYIAEQTCCGWDGKAEEGAAKEAGSDPVTALRMRWNVCERGRECVRERERERERESVCVCVCACVWVCVAGSVTLTHTHKICITERERERERASERARERDLRQKPPTIVPSLSCLCKSGINMRVLMRPTTPRLPVLTCMYKGWIRLRRREGKLLSIASVKRRRQDKEKM